MKRRISTAAVFILIFALVLSGCSVVRNGNIPSSQEISDFGAYKHYFSALSENGKCAYNAILSQIENFPERIEVPQLSDSELEQVWLAVMYDNPELIMLGRECVLTSQGRRFYFSCEYSMTRNEYQARKAEIQAKLDEMMPEIEKLEGEFDRELFIHDTLVNSCEYVSAEDMMHSTVYGALVKGTASCEGYAKAAKLLLDKAGIENYLICGTASREDGTSEGHMWNIVCLGGEKYNLDLTWDDPIGEGEIENRRYAYFNITDEDILKTHTFEGTAPGCTATAQNYFEKLGRRFDTYDADTRSAIAECFKGLSSGDKTEISFSNEKAYAAAIKGLFDNEEIYRLLSIAVAGGGKFSTNQINYIADDEHCIIEFIVI